MRQFNAKGFTSRTSQMHIEYLQLIEGEGGSRHSVTYGINGRSPLLDLVGFDITKCLPYDIMHTVFEGVAISHLKLLLNYCIEEMKYISLEQLNLLLRSHNYGHSENDTKPSPIFKDSSSYHIKQSGI